MRVDKGIIPPKHKLWYKTFMFFARTFFLPLFKFVLGIKTKKPKINFETPAIMVYNHSTDFDFICTVDLYRPYIRYVMSDMMVMGKLAGIFFPMTTDFIYRRKGEKADNTVKSVISTIKDGVSVGIAPEGGETVNGATQTIRTRTGEMIKQCNCGLVTIRLYGMYFIKPSWAKHTARGQTFGEIVGTYTKEKISNMSPEEINELIAKDLQLNQYEWQRGHKCIFKRKCRAEWMEKALYVCPKCKGIGKLHSHIHELKCECGYKLIVNEYGFYEGDEVIFDNLYDWDVWQRKYLKSQRQKWLDNPDNVILFNDHMVVQVIHNIKPETLDNDVKLSITGNSIIIDGQKLKLRIDLNKIVGLSGSVDNGIGVNYNNKYYLIKSSRPLAGFSYRFIYKVIRGEDFTNG